jgi:hypothetical protein
MHFAFFTKKPLGACVNFTQPTPAFLEKGGIGVFGWYETVSQHAQTRLNTPKHA